MGVTGLIIFQEGQSYPPPPQISRMIQYKTLRSVIFVIYIIPYFLYEVFFHYKRIKEKEKKNILFKYPAWNRPWSSGLKVCHAKQATISGRARLEITVHNPSIGHIRIHIQGK